MEIIELQLPDQAIPRRRAFEKLSLGSIDRIIERESERKKVVEKTGENKPNIQFINIIENRIMRGYGWIMLVIIEKKYLFILYLSIANINVREPNNVNTSGLIKINVKFEAKSVAGIRIPFSLSIPI